MREIFVPEDKYNGQKHYSYPLLLLSETPAVVVGYGPFGRPLTHPSMGLTRLPVQHHSVESHFRQQPFNISAGFDAAGRLKRYFCNVATPSTFADGVISSIDLDLDLVVAPDLSYHVEDEEEFA